VTSDEAESELVVYYGGAQPGDDNFADVVAIDEGIYAVIAERRGPTTKGKAMPLSLNDAQLKQVMSAAALLSPAARDGFLRSVAAVLGGRERPTDSEVISATRFVLAERGVAVGREALAIKSR
jgi:hypothetical protein